MTTETLELLLNKLPPKARRAFGVPAIQYNLIACVELIGAGCSVYLHKHGCEIVYEGETLYKGWHDTINRLWRISLALDATNRIPPYTNPEEYCLFGVNLFFLFSFFMPDLACYQKVRVGAFYCPKMSL